MPGQPTKNTRAPPAGLFQQATVLPESKAGVLHPSAGKSWPSFITSLSFTFHDVRTGKETSLKSSLDRFNETVETVFRVCLAHRRPTCPGSPFSLREHSSGKGRRRGEHGPGLGSWIQPLGSLASRGKGYRTALVVRWLRLCTPSAGGWGSIPGQGTRSHVPQLRLSTAQINNK